MSESFHTINRFLQEHGDGGSKLVVQVVRDLADEDSLGQTYVLLEGDQNSLRFLAETILAHLETDACDLAMHPSGAGSVHFHALSNVGICLHLLPCEHGSIAQSSSVNVLKLLG